MDSSRTTHQRWLDAYSDPRASIYTFSRCMALSDLQADGDYKLIMADLGSGSANIKLKVYKGVSLMTETTLLEIPTGLITFYNDQREPKLPAIAVSSGPNIYVYKNMKPYFKFTLPDLEVNPLETDLWIQARNEGMEPKLLYNMLDNIRNEVGYSNMSSHTQKLLTLSPENEMEMANFIKMHCEQPIKRQTVITCMTTLFKSTKSYDSVACIVLGSESGCIYIVDSEAFTILDSVNQSLDFHITDQTIPVLIKAVGLYDVDYRIVTYNRDGKITLLRRGWKQVKVLVHLSVQAVDMCLINESGNIIIVNMNSCMECYSKKGRKLWDLKLSSNAMSMLAIPLPSLGLTLMAVALNGGLICCYNGRQLVDTIAAADTIAGMIFGRFGQEEHCLILVTVGGILQVKMLKRTAQFSNHTTSSPSSTNPNLKLQMPKKTKHFLENTAREKENSLYIHQSFQRDLYRFRLDTARQYAESLKKTNNLISNDSHLPLKLSAQVFGLGPTFKIQLTLENMSQTSEHIDVLIGKDLGIVFHFNEKMYEVVHPYIHVPVLVPGLSYKFETIVRTTTDITVSDEIHIFIISAKETKPILSAVIYMPVCDVLPIEI